MPSTNSIPRRIWHLAHTQSLGQWWDQHLLHEEHHPSLHLCYYLGNTWLWWLIFDTFKGHTGSEMQSLLLGNNIISVYSFQKLHWCTSTTESLCEQAPERPPYDQGSNQMVDGKQPEDTEGDMKLSVMKPLSAGWLSLSMPIYLRTAVQCGLHRKYLAKSIEISQGLTRWCKIYLIRLFAWFLQGSCMIWQVLCKNNLTNLG